MLSFNALQIGVWAAAAPGSWFRTFPGFGQVWAGADGPFNEHLTRDVGNLFLALAVVSIAALVRPGSQSVRTAAAAWLVMSVPHLTYHGLHADLLPASSAAMSLSGLALAVLVPAWLLWRPLPAGLGARATAAVAPTVPPVAASA